MSFEWVPEALKQLGQYPDDRFWGILFVVTFIIIFFTWLFSKS